MFYYWRFVFALVSFFGLILVYMLRVNLSVAIVAMVNSSVYEITNSTPECSIFTINKSQPKKANDGEYPWSESDQTILLSSFYWGYALMQIPSGILLLFFKAKWIYGLSTLTTSILTFFIPMFANWGVYYMVTLRFLMGMCEGPTFPALYTLCGCWVLQKESSVIMILILSGSSFGIIIGQSLTGLIIAQIGWRMMFYIMGSFGCVWFVIYGFVIFDKPTNHPFISDYEKKLLVDSLPHNQPGYKPVRLNIPWKQVATSRPYIGYLIFATAYNFTWFTMINCLPMYIGVVLGFDIASNGGISSLPYITFIICGIIGGSIQDYMKFKNKISGTKIRKIFGCGGVFGSSAMLFLIIFAGCNVGFSITIVCISISLLGFASVVNGVNLIDLAPAHAGPLLSLVNTMNALCGITSPFIKNLFTSTGETRSNWQSVFITDSAILFTGAFVFLAFGSATLQPWAIIEGDRNLLINVDESESDEFHNEDNSYLKNNSHIAQ